MAKISNTHSTQSNEAREIIGILRKSDGVSKITRGPIARCRPIGKKRVKIVRMSGGYQLKIRGGNTVQSIMVYSKSSDTMFSLETMVRNLGYELGEMEC